MKKMEILGLPKRFRAEAYVMDDAPSAKVVKGNFTENELHAFYLTGERSFFTWLHNEHGPAWVIYRDDKVYTFSFWLNGKCCSEKEWKHHLFNKNLNEVLEAAEKT